MQKNIRNMLVVLTLHEAFSIQCCSIFKSDIVCIAFYSFVFLFSTNLFTIFLFLKHMDYSYKNSFKYLLIILIRWDVLILFWSIVHCPYASHMLSSHPMFTVILRHFFSKLLKLALN